MRRARTRVAPISLEEPLRALEVPDGYDHVLLVPTYRGEVLGEAPVRARGRVTPDVQRAAIEGEIADRLMRRRLADAFRRAGGAPEARPEPGATSVSVVVCARGGDPAECLESVDRLRRAPDQVIVVGPVPGDGRNLARARNRGVMQARGDMIAFTHEDCRVDPGWLDAVDAACADSLVMAIGGYVGSEAPATRRTVEPMVDDLTTRRRVTLDTRNALIRRVAFERLGLFRDEPGADGAPEGAADAEFSRRVVRAGYRLAADPARIVWQRGADEARGPGRWWQRARAAARPASVPGLDPVGRDRRPDVTVAGAEHPHLTVAIASYNRRRELAGALEAISAQSYPAERFEAVVVLDGSTDGSAELVRSLPAPYPLRLVEQDNRGLGASRNRGAREASGPIVVFLDDDAFPEPDFLARHAAAHRDAHDERFVLGYTPPVVRDAGLWSIAIRNWWEDFFRRRREPEHRWTFMDVADGNSSISRSLFLDCEGFDEGLERRHDWEFGARILKRGVGLAHLHEAVAWHHFDTSFAAALRNRRHEGRADIPFATRHPEAKGRLHLAGFAGLAGRGMGARRVLAYSHPRAAEPFARAGVAALRLLEALNLPRRWARLSQMVLAHAYLRGVADALPAVADFRAFMAPALAGEGARTVDVDLDATAPSALPSAGAGWLRLVLRLAGEPVATVVAPEPGLQWDWAAITERAVEGCAAAIGDAAPEQAARLGDLAASDLSLGTPA